MNLLTTALQLLDGIAAPAPTPTPAPTGNIDTAGIIGWCLTRILPILLVGLGFLVIGLARSGNMSRVATMTVIVAVGVVFIGGAGAFAAFGDNLADVIFE